MTDAVINAANLEGEADAPSSVWLLFDDRPGHNTQVTGIANALGWRGEEKRLAFNAFNKLPNRILGASSLSLDQKRSDALKAPWPDLVIAMGRRSAPIARWIKRQSGARTKVVLLGRKAANQTGAYDLAVACRHFQLPSDANRLDLVIPPTQVTAESLEAAAARWPDLMADARSPKVVLLVGGSTVLHKLKSEEAAKLAATSFTAAKEAGGSLTIVTSRRTGEKALAAMRVAAPDAHFHVWQRDANENPYMGFLAECDILVVTGESESMLAEAAMTGKPLYIFPLVERDPSVKLRLKQAVYAASKRQGLFAAICRAILVGGWLEPPRDIAAMHLEMVKAGHAKIFSGSLQIGRREPGWQEGGVVAQRVRALFKGSQHK